MQRECQEKAQKVCMLAICYATISNFCWIMKLIAIFFWLWFNLVLIILDPLPVVSSHTDQTTLTSPLSSIFVDEHITLRVILNKSSGMTIESFKAKKSKLVPVPLKKTSATSNGAKFCSFHHGSLMEDTHWNNTYKLNKNLSLDIKDLTEKEQGEYIVIGSIRWIREVIRNTARNSLVTITLQAWILMEVIQVIPVTLWGNHISNIIENQCYQITDVAIRKYYGTKLSATPMSIFEEMEKESAFDWLEVGTSNYLNHEK